MHTELFVEKTEENLRQIKHRFSHPNIIDIRLYDAESTDLIRVYIRHPELDVERGLTIDPYGFKTFKEAEEFIKSKIKKQ